MVCSAGLDESAKNGNVMAVRAVTINSRMNNSETGFGSRDHRMTPPHTLKSRVIPSCRGARDSRAIRLGRYRPRPQSDAREPRAPQHIENKTWRAGRRQPPDISREPSGPRADAHRFAENRESRGRSSLPHRDEERCLMHRSASAVRDDPFAAMRSRVTSLVVNEGEKAEDSRESPAYAVMGPKT